MAYEDYKQKQRSSQGCKHGKTDKTARLYRRKGSRVKSELKFETPRSKRTGLA